MRRVMLMAVLAGSIVPPVHGAISADRFPDKPLRLIVPQAPGATADIMARLIGQKLTDAWKKNVVVDNRPAAGGITALELAAKSPPDGHTLVLSTEGALTINPGLYRNLPYDPVRDFAPVSRLGYAPYVLVVHPELGTRNVKELIALARAKPGTINFGSGGNGTGTHLTGELFRSAADIRIVHVPYKGAPPALTDVIAGQVQMMFGGLPLVRTQVRAGRVRALAVTTLQRSPALPEVPALAESGLPGFAVSPWWGILAPSGTPRAVVDKLHREVVNSLAAADVKEAFAQHGAVAIGDAPAEFGAAIRAELVKWSRVIRDAGIRVE